MWLRVLLIFFLAYLVIKVVTRIIMPFRAVKKDFEEQVRRGQTDTRHRADTRQEGDVRVEEPRKTDSGTPSVDGEYVEYEEVE